MEIIEIVETTAVGHDGLRGSDKRRQTGVQNDQFSTDSKHKAVPKKRAVPDRTTVSALTPAQQELVSRHIGLVRLHLRTRVPTPKTPRRNREYEDLFQEGCMALMRAATRYKPERHGEFPSYALPRIRGAVHAALHNRFSMIHIPTRARLQAKRTEDTNKPPWPMVFDGLDNSLEFQVQAPAVLPEGIETIRLGLRRRYERAVQQALADLRARTWTRRDPGAIMARIAEERLLVAEESLRTPLRQIARELRLSSGRVGAYAQKLAETVRQYFEADPQVSLLVQFAGQDGDRFDAPIDHDRRERLLQAELDDFEKRFVKLAMPQRAELTYHLIERSASAVVEVARNLYQLTLSEMIEPAFPWPMSA